MDYPVEDPRRGRVFDAGVENLEALAEVLSEYASKLETAVEMYDGEEQFRKATEFNRVAVRAYETIDEWQDDSEEYDDELLGKDPQVLAKEAQSVDKDEVQRRVDARNELLAAERNYLDAVRKAEQEVECSWRTVKSSLV
ncbi:hypothetical protein [Candidatus Nanohalobium constans]|uniref:Uncharacterized protein n=1 Tax=Candidatus Nanohalobium constans TaxID=2565781 RepID=A0A5Q0UGI4_9ARCH|nr:hypothetical protein [Candidatus Nanohalobium constans]QGA80752.1 hypothetical protein LC1Nh_0868 [Candidatus Nanohalobium constans]